MNRKATFTIGDGRMVETTRLNDLMETWSVFDQHEHCPTGAVKMPGGLFVMVCQDHGAKHLVVEEV